MICDSLAISYHSRDIDDTIAEEEEPVEDIDDDRVAEDASDHTAIGAPYNGRGQQGLKQVNSRRVLGGERKETDEQEQEEGETSMMASADSGGTTGGRDAARDRRSSSNSNSRSKSRSVSPRYSKAATDLGGTTRSGRGATSGGDRGRSNSAELGGKAGVEHNYVNSAPNEAPMGSGFNFGPSGGGSGPIPAIPPPPRKQQSFNRQPQQQEHILIDIDSDPHGTESDAIRTDDNRSILAATTVNNRINGRVVPGAGSPQHPQSQLLVEEGKIMVPARLRNGFMERNTAWPQQGSPSEIIGNAPTTSY